MSEQTIKYQYQVGVITGGYSFSANNNIITLSGYVEELENAKVREAIQFEAQKARTYYVEKVNRIKAAGGKVNNFLTKYEAVKRAKEDAKAMYADVWDEVEAINKTHDTPIASPQSPISSDAGESLKDNPLTKILVAVMYPEIPDDRCILSDAKNMVINAFPGYKVKLNFVLCKRD